MSGRLSGAEGALGAMVSDPGSRQPGVQTLGPAPPTLAAPGFMAPMWACLDTGQGPGILAVLTR